MASPKLFDTEDSIASKINRPFAELAADASTRAWDTTLFPDNKFLLVNIPISTTTSRQYVVNMLSGAWTLFRGWNAYSFATVGDSMYFGGAAGNIYKCDTGYADNDSEIDWEIKWSPNYLGSTTKEKAIKEVLPIIKSDSPVSFAFAADADFEDRGYSANAAVSVDSGSAWDTSEWDSSPWAGVSYYNKDRFSVPVTGTAISFKMKGSTKNVYFEVIALKVLFELVGSR